MTWKKTGRLVVGLVLGLALAACASSPPPRTSESLGAARAAIQSAEQQDAERYAPDLLAQARRSLTRAENAHTSEDYEMAARMAEEARLDARLAAVRADLASTRQLVQELETSIQILEREASL